MLLIAALSIVSCNGDDDEAAPIAVSEPCNLTIPSVTSNSGIIVGDTIKLQTAYLPNATYQWTGPNNFTSTDQNPLIPHASSAMGGNYQVTVSQGVCVSDIGSFDVLINMPIYPCDLEENTSTVGTSIYTVESVSYSPGGEGYHASIGISFQAPPSNPTYNRHLFIEFPMESPPAGVYQCGASSSEVRFQENYGSAQFIVLSGELYLNFTPEGKAHIVFCDLPRYVYAIGAGSGMASPPISGRFTSTN